MGQQDSKSDQIKLSQIVPSLLSYSLAQRTDSFGLVFRLSGTISTGQAGRKGPGYEAKTLEYIWQLVI